ncbi:MAG: IS200/IS605 family transposase [Niabella sp.]
MANTYTKLYIQIVFAVKGRRSLIRESYRKELQKYIAGIISNKQQKLYAIYCMPDHVHILVSVSPDIAISDLVRDIKSNATSFINDKKWISERFEWQRGFGAFSYHESLLPIIVNYIMTQPEHHKVKSFKQEYITLLKEFNIDFDNKYLFDFIDEEKQEPHRGDM